jgi:glucose-6-phosphate isomerase
MQSNGHDYNSILHEYATKIIQIVFENPDLVELVLNSFRSNCIQTWKRKKTSVFFSSYSGETTELKISLELFIVGLLIVQEENVRFLFNI